MKKILSKIYLLLIFIFLYAPIILLVIFSFNESKSRSKFTGFTLNWYEELFKNDQIISSLISTLIIGVLASIIATILGTMAAIGIQNMKKRTRTTIMNFTYLPIINPEIITGISLMLLFVFIAQHSNFKLGFLSVLISHITFCVPYVILSVMPKLRQVDKSLFEAAQDLGCNNNQAFFKVIVPEIMPGIITGLLMSFTFSIDDFVISYFTTGSSFQTLPITIYSMTRKKVNPQINALSAIIFLIVLIILIIVNIKDAKKEQKRLKGE